MPGESLYTRCLAPQARRKLGFRDSLIVAAALQAAGTRRLSENLPHGQRIEGLPIHGPCVAG